MVGIAHDERCVRDVSLRGKVGGLLAQGVRGVEADDLALGDIGGEVDGDGAGPAADVEEAVCGLEMGEEVAGGVGCRAPAVGGEDGFVVAVGVLRCLVGGGHCF